MSAKPSSVLPSKDELRAKILKVGDEVLGILPPVVAQIKKINLLLDYAESAGYKLDIVQKIKGVLENPDCDCIDFERVFDIYTSSIESIRLGTNRSTYEGLLGIEKELSMLNSTYPNIVVTSNECKEILIKEGFFAREATLKKEFEEKMRAKERKEAEEKALRAQKEAEEKAAKEQVDREQARKNEEIFNRSLIDLLNTDKQWKQDLLENMLPRKAKAALGKNEPKNLDDFLTCLGLLFSCLCDKNQPIKDGYDYGDRSSAEVFHIIVINGTINFFYTTKENRKYLSRSAGSNVRTDLLDLFWIYDEQGKKKEQKFKEDKKISMDVAKARGYMTDTMSTFLAKIPSKSGAFTVRSISMLPIPIKDIFLFLEGLYNHIKKTYPALATLSENRPFKGYTSPEDLLKEGEIHAQACLALRKLAIGLFPEEYKQHLESQAAAKQKAAPKPEVKSAKEGVGVAVAPASAPVPASASVSAPAKKEQNPTIKPALSAEETKERHAVMVAQEGASGKAKERQESPEHQPTPAEILFGSPLLFRGIQALIRGESAESAETAKYYEDMIAQLVQQSDSNPDGATRGASPKPGPKRRDS